jgi:hypothetical protein
MVPIQRIKTIACPVCGCAVVVSESIEVEIDRPEVRRHCNGGQWEHRRFACGYETKYVPNFDKESRSKVCKTDPEVLERKRKTDELKESLMQMINSSDLPQYVKDNLADGIRYK